MMCDWCLGPIPVLADWHVLHGGTFHVCGAACAAELLTVTERRRSWIGRVQVPLECAGQLTIDGHEVGAT